MKKLPKLNQKGIAHHFLLIVLAVLVVGAVGFAGYRIYSNKKLDAQAAGWTSLGGAYSGRLYACKSGSAFRVVYKGPSASLDAIVEYLTSKGKRLGYSSVKTKNGFTTRAVLPKGTGLVRVQYVRFADPIKFASSGTVPLSGIRSC